MIIAFLFFSVIFAARQLSPSIRGIEKFSRELEMRMREKKHPQRVVIPKEERHPVTGDVHCATMPVYEHHARYFNISAATCGLSQCDDPTIRDQTPLSVLKLRTAWTVWNNQISHAQLTATITEFQKLFATYYIEIVVEKTAFVSDTTYGTCLPPYDDTDYWYDALLTLKNKHAITPDKALNVFVGCQTQGQQGTLLGIATFPWDPFALTGYGGLWMNKAVMFPDDSTLLHESGHCLGLWHVFHGVDEIVNCAPDATTCAKNCCEKPHASSDHTSAASNLVGDMCSDTMSQPRFWECAQPAGEACNGDQWTQFGPVDYENTMSYAMIDDNGQEEHCQTGFSVQQTRRMHCYISDLLSSWIA